MANRRRPRRGPAGGNILVTGDVGTTAGPQGGAEPGATESGDLDAREFGVPQADIPGGLRHVVNPEAVPVDTTDKPRRPADYHKYHGVPSDDGQYYVTPGVEKDKPAMSAPEPKFDEAVPVRVVESNRPHVIKKLVTSGPLIVASGTVDPVHLALRDPNRADFWICNETTAGGSGQTNPGIRIGDYETTADLRGLLIPAATIQRLNEVEDEVYVTNQSGTSITISWGYVTEIEASGA